VTGTRGRAQRAGLSRFVEKDTMSLLSDIRSHTTPPGAVEQSATEGGALPVCTIAVQRHVTWTAVMLRGELDRQSGGELKAAVAEALAENRPIVVELVGLDFCDLDGIRSLAYLARQGERCRGHIGIEIHGARGQVARLIQLLGLEDVLGVSAQRVWTKSAE